MASVSSYEVSALLNISANKLSSTTLILLLILRGHMVHRHAAQPHGALQGERGGERKLCDELIVSFYLINKLLIYFVSTVY